MNEAAPLVWLAAGGTGGHMFPAQALAEALVARGWRVKLSTDARGARFAGNFPPEVEVEEVAAATFARGGLGAKARVPFVLARGVLSALLAMRRDRPALVVGFGGYPTIPAMAAAGLIGVPRIIHEQNGVLGRVNRLFAPRVDRVACGTWPTDLPEGARGADIGNPVRSGVRARAGAPYIAPGDYPMSVLVFGGSQGARVLSDRVPAAIAGLPKEIRRHVSVSQQAREEDVERVDQAYEAAGIRAEVRPFFEDIARRLSEAQLVISRAGASSIADISVIGRPAILVPFAQAAGDHQSANARGLAEAGAAVALREDELDTGRLAGEIAAILGDPERAQQMAAEALSQGKPDATERLVALVEEVSGKHGAGA